MPPTLYAAMKMKIKNQGYLKDNPAWEEKLRATVDSINELFKPFLASKLFIHNDEIHGVLFIQEAPRFIQILQVMDLEINPVKLYFTLGVGNITTELKPVAVEMEGPAWKAAQRALKELMSGNGDVLVRLPSPFLTRTINTLFTLESDLRNNWSDAHRETIKLARQGMTQVEMAEILGITQAAVSQRLKHAHWDKYLQVCDSIRELLSQARWRTILPWDLGGITRKKRSKKTVKA